MRGDVRGAGEMLSRLQAQLDTGDFDSTRWIGHEIEGRLAALAGDLGAAAAGLERAAEGALRTDPSSACDILLALVDVLLAAGRRDRAAEWGKRMWAEIAPRLHAASTGRQRLRMAAERLKAADA